MTTETLTPIAPTLTPADYDLLSRLATLIRWMDEYETRQAVVRTEDAL